MHTILQLSDLAPEDRDLLSGAQDACKFAYAPYSRFRVGAAARLADGTIALASNLENASYGLSICAEVALLATINSQGKTDQVQKIALSSTRHKSIEDLQFLTPCGRCRQLLVELTARVGTDIPVLMADFSGQSVLLSSCLNLLPHAFSPSLLR